MIACWAKNATFVSTNFSSTKYAFQGKIKVFIIQLSKAITYFSVPRQNMSVFFQTINYFLRILHTIRASEMFLSKRTLFAKGRTFDLRVHANYK